MMRSLFTTVAGTGLLFFSLVGLQAAPQDDQDKWYQDREGYYHGEGWHARFFERVRQDLDHVQSIAFSGSDEDRVVETKQRLDDLQRKHAEGRYDQPELEQTIVSLRRVVDDNRLSGRDHDILKDDLDRMQDYRENHDRWR